MWHHPVAHWSDTDGIDLSYITLKYLRPKITEQPLLSMVKAKVWHSSLVWNIHKLKVFLTFPESKLLYILLKKTQYKMKRRITIFHSLKWKEFYFNWMVIFMSMLFKAGPWKCMCLERPFSEAQGLSLPWFCVVKKSRDGRGIASAFSFNRKSHISKWKAFRNKAAIMFLWKGCLPFGLRYLL